MQLYGFKTFTHGWQYVLTIMSPDGARAADEYLDPGDDIGVEARVGHLTRYYEKREGAFDQLVARYRIEILERDDWDRIKAELGPAILN